MQLEEINEALEAANIKKSETFPVITWIKDSAFRFIYLNALYTYNIRDKVLSSLNKYNEKGENIDLNEKLFYIAYTIKNNLYVAVRGQQLQVTNDEDKGIVNGKSVHRERVGNK